MRNYGEAVIFIAFLTIFHIINNLDFPRDGAENNNFFNQIVESIMQIDSSDKKLFYSNSS